MAEIKVAVMNTSKELTELLLEVFKDEGFSPCATFTYLFKGHEERFAEYIKQHKPEIILYDIGIPYVENYELFKKVSSSELGKAIPFVLSTTNKVALEKLVGKTDSYEIIGKPYDLQIVMNTIRNVYKKSSSH